MIRKNSDKSWSMRCMTNDNNDKQSRTTQTTMNWLIAYIMWHSGGYCIHLYRHLRIGVNSCPPYPTNFILTLHLTHPFQASSPTAGMSNAGRSLVISNPRNVPHLFTCMYMQILYYWEWACILQKGGFWSGIGRFWLRQLKHMYHPTISIPRCAAVLIQGQGFFQGLAQGFFWKILWHKTTLPKTNMEPHKNGGLEDDFPFSKGVFLEVPAVHFWV